MAVPGPPTPPPIGRTAQVYAVSAAGAVAVVLIVLVALMAAGLGPWAPTPPGGPETFANARGPATAAANAFSASGWEVIGAAGFASPVSVSLPTANFTSSVVGTGCTLDTTPSLPAALAIAAQSNVSTGAASAWIFVFKSTTGAGGLIVGVDNGRAAVWGALSGTLCATAFGFVTSLDASIADSSAVAAAVNRAGGTAFLRGAPQAYALYSISGGVSAFLTSSIASNWGVSYVDCPVTGGSGAVSSQFVATADPSNATVTLASTEPTVCAGLVGSLPANATTTPVSTALSFARPVTATNGTAYSYTFPINHTTTLIVAGELVLSANGLYGPVSPSPPIAVVTSTGVPVAVYDPAHASWLSGLSTLLLPGDAIRVGPTTTDLSGGQLLVTGQGTLSGSETVDIP